MDNDQFKDMMIARLHRRTPSGFDEELIRLIRWGLVKRLGFDDDIGHVSERARGIKCLCTPRTIDPAGEFLINPQTDKPYQHKDEQGNLVDIRVLVGTPVEVDPDDLMAMCCKDSTTADQLPERVRACRQSQLDELEECCKRDDVRLRDLRRSGK